LGGLDLPKESSYRSLASIQREISAMNNLQLTFLIAAIGIVASSPLPAAVKVAGSEPSEKLVAMLTADKKYLTANTGGTIDLSGTKVGSKQKFTLIDLNGGTLDDGDQVKIRYTPNVGGVPDPAKANYWHESPTGIKRSGKQSDVFKLKLMDGKYAFQTLAGKFLGKPVNGALSLADKAEDALVVEIVDVAGAASASQATEAPPAETPPAQ
jgi:hypothetical protein